MNEVPKWPDGEGPKRSVTLLSRTWPWAVGVIVVAAAVLTWNILSARDGSRASSVQLQPAPVTVSQPLLHDVDTRIEFLGQFSAVDRVELRAQVGGTLTEIDFRDGQIVQKGALLFVIDPRPYEIKLAEAKALLQTASARFALASSELLRAQSLKSTNFGTAESVDQRESDRDTAAAAMDDARAQIRDAELDIEYCHILAPFTGRIGEHSLSIGNLVAGSRAATSPTTVLATLVSLDPIYLDFDMSESDYLAYARTHEGGSEPQSDKVEFRLSDEDDATRHGTLDFIDNALDRSSGTIHARAIVANPDLFLTPGEFARLRLAISPPVPALMVPDSAVILDQSQHLVMTVAADGTVVPKVVRTGDLRGGLRIIREGLLPSDRVIINGLVRAMPGGKVTPQPGMIRYDASQDGQG